MPEAIPAAQVGQAVTVQKLNSRGALVFAYPGVIAATFPNGVRIHARWTRSRMALDYTTFEPGDHFSEWFFSDRWYNIMEVRAPGGALKGWYCNIAWPAQITPETVSYRDLTLDLWVAPDGSALTLDMDEFEADTILSAGERAQALAALDEVRGHLWRREAPFDRLAETLA